jgi:hypothetical protein
MAADPRRFLAERKSATEERFERIRQRLQPVEHLVGSFATVYGTGSFGRSEASEHSDLDAFILTAVDDHQRPVLTSVDTIRLQGALVDAAAKEGLPPFSEDGAYLEPHTLVDMIEKLGGRDDDYENLFTARMLLLLESRPLLGKPFYERAINQVFAEYWRDFQDNEGDFLPIYLTNDIIRYWKVLCLNYEANTKRAENPNKRRLINYKLKHSRLLTCYSAVLYLCHHLRTHASVSIDDARSMSALSPVGRLLDIAETADTTVVESIEEVLRMYADFLGETDVRKSELLRMFDDVPYRTSRHKSGIEFGNRIFELLKLIGEHTPLFRYLVV